MFTVIIIIIQQEINEGMSSVKENINCLTNLTAQNIQVQ